MAGICLGEPSTHWSFFPWKALEYFVPKPHSASSCRVQGVKHLPGHPRAGRGSRWLGGAPFVARAPGQGDSQLFPWKTRPLHVLGAARAVTTPRWQEHSPRQPRISEGRSGGRNYIKISENEVPHFTHPCNPRFSSCFMDERLKEEKPTLLKWESDEVSFFLGSESRFHSTDEDVQNLLGFNLLFYPPVLWQCNYISLASFKTCSFPRNLMQKRKSFSTFPSLCCWLLSGLGLCFSSPRRTF